MPNDLLFGSKKGRPQPSEGGGVVMIACEIPAQWAERVRAERLVPRVLVFEQVSGDLVAGQPVKLPVRELTPYDVLVMAQRAIQGGQIVPAIAFQIPEQPPTAKPKPV